MSLKKILAATSHTPHTMVTTPSKKRSKEELTPLLMHLTEGSFTALPTEKQNRLIDLFKNITQRELSQLEIETWPSQEQVAEIYSTLVTKGYEEIIKLAERDNHQFDRCVLQLFCSNIISEETLINLCIASATIKDKMLDTGMKIVPVSLEKYKHITLQSSPPQQLTLDGLEPYEKMAWAIITVNESAPIAKVYPALLDNYEHLPRLSTEEYSQKKIWVMPSPAMLKKYFQLRYGANAVQATGVLGRSNPIDIKKSLTMDTRHVVLPMSDISDFEGIVHDAQVGQTGLIIHDLDHLLYCSFLTKEERIAFIKFSESISKLLQTTTDPDARKALFQVRDQAIDMVSSAPSEQAPERSPMETLIIWAVSHKNPRNILVYLAQYLRENPNIETSEILNKHISHLSIMNLRDNPHLDNLLSLSRKLFNGSYEDWKMSLPFSARRRL